MKKPDEKIAGFLQATQKAIDFTPIYYFAITKNLKAGTVLRWDKAETKLTVIAEVSHPSTE